VSTVFQLYFFTPIFSGLFPIFSGLLYGDVIEAANVAEGESTTSMASYAGAKSDMKKVVVYSVVSCFSVQHAALY
jgi:hypothetical protein